MSVRNHPKCRRPKDSPYRTKFQCGCPFCAGMYGGGDFRKKNVKTPVVAGNKE